MKLKRKWGWKPDLPDNRDYTYSSIMKVPAKLPDKVDLRVGCPPIEDQGNLGSCTANALTGAMEFLLLKDKKPLFHLSRLFLYYNERAIEGSVGYDSGVMIRDGIKSMAKEGVCTEKLWPYNIKKYRTKPSKTCYTEAEKHQILSYYRIATVDQMKTCLAKGYPFVFGFSVYESFETQEVARTGNVPVPKRTEKLLGGHAVLAVGYDNSLGKVIVRNSWGTDWGDKGYCYMPYAYFSNRSLSDDFWYVSSQEE